MRESASRKPSSPANPAGKTPQAEDTGAVLHPLPPGMISSEQTGLPGLTTWPRVYLLVVSIFVLWVVLLSLFMHRYS